MQLVIPVLCDADIVLAAIQELRTRQNFQITSNRESSSRYQSELGKELHKREHFKTCKKVHNLRGIYACLVNKLFKYNETFSYVTMKILGHSSITESLTYTSFHIHNLNVGVLGDGYLQPAGA